MKKNKISQEKCAAFLNIRRPSLSEWKKDGTIPKADIALKIADFLNTSVRFLVTGKENQGIPAEILEISQKIDKLPESEKKEITILLNAKLEKIKNFTKVKQP